MGKGGKKDTLFFVVLVGLGLLAGTGLYLTAFSGLRAPYLFVVLLHVGIGLALLPMLAAYLWRHVRTAQRREKTRRSITAGWTAAVLALACAVFGLSLMATGATRPHTPELWLHQFAGWGLLAGALVHLLLLPREQRRATFKLPALRWAGLAAVGVMLVAGVIDVAVSRLGESGLAHADLPKADFAPSLAATATGGLIAPDALSDAKACGRCHKEIYAEWEASAHHFASFNNPFYRKSVEYAAERVGAPPTKFCGACHDPLLLFSGQMDHPVDAARPEARAGITCQVCHGITEIRDLRGNGSYTIAPPGQYPFAGSRSPFLRDVHDLMVRLKPGPHREAMLKPIHTTPEFCSVCHKVHIPEAVNHFKWTRGQDEYDNWQHSGVSGYATLSWGPPNPSPKICRDCHMPAVASDEVGAKRRQTEGPGKAKPYTIRDHRFLAANTALPTINNNPEQLKATEQFLQDKKVSVEVVAVDPVSRIPNPGSCYLSLNACTVQSGETLDLHVLVRNLGVGHTFPGGTLDSNEVWLEVTARDAGGRVFFHHGGLEPDGSVDPKAHFYKSVLLDRSAQLIDKRNVHDWVSTLYARTIPPGAADVARYRVTIPNDAGDRISIDVVLHYRKFMDGFTKFVYAGRRAPDQVARVDQYVDESKWTVTNAPVPDLPIVTMAESRTMIPVKGAGARGQGPGRAENVPVDSASSPLPVTLHPLPSEAIQLLNSYGIGLLQQQDLKTAWSVLEQLTQRAPQFVEGFINLARVQLADGALGEADVALHRALALAPDYPKALYLLGKVRREQGDYRQARGLYTRLAARYPKDRVLCNEIAQLDYLNGRYQEAIRELQEVLAIDPENLAATYYLMLSYTALGESDRAKEAEQRYLRYKPDESVAQLAGDYRLRHSETLLETQPMHIHE